MKELGFSNVRGYKDIVAHMQNAVHTRKISHAYLLVGEKGSGKKLLANNFAAALLCKSSGQKPCGDCISCKKAAHKNHPDIIWVYHKKPELIAKDEIKEQIVKTVDIRPYESNYKIYIIPDADKMNAASQNTFLKTLEEPPAYVIILLLADNADTLLETVRSRCVRLDLRSLPDNEVCSYLQEELNCPPDEAKFFSSFAQGNIGRACSISRDETFRELLDTSTQLIKNIHATRVVDIVDHIKYLVAQKDYANDFLDILLYWFRDVLLYKAIRDDKYLIFQNSADEIKKESTICSYEGLEAIISAIEKARLRIHSYVNFELTMELLLLTIRDNISQRKVSNNL